MMAAPGPIRPHRDGCRLDVRVTSRANHSRIGAVRDGVLQIHVNAPPADGAANAELLSLLASTLRIGRARLAIVGGEHGRRKVVAIEGLAPRDAERALVRPAG